MDITAFIRAVADGYDRHAGLATPTQDLLRRAGAHLQPQMPGGLHVAGSGGKGTATLTPWIGFFDPDETTSPEEGLYVVYLFAADLQSVSLMLLQGITKLDRQLGHREARRHLDSEAAAIRAALHAGALDGLETSVDLGSSGYRQLAYSSACVAAKRYEIAALPPEDEARHDLLRILDLYQEAIDVKRQLALTGARTSTEATAAQQQRARTDPLAYFRPKDESDYFARLERRELVKSRRHERLIREYGEWIRTRGYLPSTSEHPKDLVLRRGGAEWLVEAKVLYRGNATDAVRAVLGQLFTYRYFLYPPDSPPGLVGLFPEPIGEAYVRFLEEIGVATVWKEDGRWLGSASAQAAEIAE
jgi:MrcB-like, N-terminal domain